VQAKLDVLMGNAGLSDEQLSAAIRDRDSDQVIELGRLVPYPAQLEAIRLLDEMAQQIKPLEAVVLQLERIDSDARAIVESIIRLLAKG
jgi:hypothetical protein